MNKTEFHIDCDKFHIVITLNSKKFLHMMNSNNCDYITFIEAVFIADCTLPSMLIFKKMNTLAKWAMKNDLNEDIVFECSQSEFANDEIAVDWLQHLIKHVRFWALKKWILLIINGFESHVIIQLLELITTNNVILFVLSFHITHFTQLLNVGVFQFYKHHHVEAIDKTVRLNDFCSTIRHCGRIIYKSWR